MAEPLTALQVRQADVRKLNDLFGVASLKKADRLGVLIRGWEKLGPRQKLDALRGEAVGTQPVADNDARHLGSAVAS